MMTCVGFSGSLAERAQGMSATRYLNGDAGVDTKFPIFNLLMFLCRTFYTTYRVLYSACR